MTRLLVCLTLLGCFSKSVLGYVRGPQMVAVNRLKIRSSNLAPSGAGQTRAFAFKDAAPKRQTVLNAVLENVTNLVAEQLGVDKAKITPQSSFIQDLGADSLDSVELVMALEEKFGVQIPDESASKITTVQQAVDYIEQHKPQA